MRPLSGGAPFGQRFALPKTARLPTGAAYSGLRAESGSNFFRADFCRMPRAPGPFRQVELTFPKV